MQRFGWVCATFLSLLMMILAGVPTAEAVTPQIAAGANHTVALKGDGTVWAWGANWGGQLGDDSTTDRSIPVQVSGISGITAIAAGANHTVALKDDGTVWVWGRNAEGELGDGTTANRGAPVQVIGLSGVTAIAAGGGHTLALKSDGTMWAWGYNGNGQLGDGTTTIQTTPVQVSGISGVTAIAAGSQHSMALKGDGTVWAWGANWRGLLGVGDTEKRTTPVQVWNLSGVTAIAAGTEHSMALKGDGTVWAWGWGGQLGIGDTGDRTTPVRVSGLFSVTAISAGMLHSVALRNDGTVWAWGYNLNGQLGVGDTGDRKIPVQVSDISGIAAIAVGQQHTVALKYDDTVWVWGNNDYGQLGIGIFLYNQTTPVQVSGLSDVITIAAGSNHSVALKNDGTVWAWGHNLNGQLGDGTWIDRTTPVQVSGLSGVIAIAAGGQHTVALKDDGTVWGWGANGSGQLGDGTQAGRMTPVQVSNLSGVTAIAAGWSHTLALKYDGTVWAWGSNGNGQLGDGTTTPRSSPVRAIELTGVTALAAGSDHSVALKMDSTVWAWGSNQDGRLGDGTTTRRLTPVPVSGLKFVTAVAAARGSYTLALRDDDTVWAWGNNDHGQLGDGTTTKRFTPVQVSGLYFVGVTAIAASSNHSVAVGDKGSVWAWGGNVNGQLGDGTTTMQTTPVRVSGLFSVTAIAAGANHTVALKNDGTMLAWGHNRFGQLGIGTDYRFPTQALINLGTGVPQMLYVTPDAGPNGALDPNYPQGVLSGETAVFTVIPDSGYQIGSVSGCGGSLEGNLYTTAPVYADCAVNAAFEPVTNTPPIAHATADPQVLLVRDTVVQLDGSGSWDADNDLLAYQWAFVSKPLNSQAALSDPGAVDPSFVADVWGTYVVSLVVRDAWSTSTPTLITVSFEDVPPVAVAGDNQIVRVGTTVYLDGSTSYDLNDEPLIYTWFFGEIPEGSATEIYNYNSAQASFVADAAGIYEVFLGVTDCWPGKPVCKLYETKFGVLDNLIVTAVTAQAEATEDLIYVVDQITFNIDLSQFTNSNMFKPLTKSLSIVVKLIDQGDYEQALEKLKEDIIQKIDGCGGDPNGTQDKNDWLDCEAQAEIYPYILSCIDALESLVQGD